MIFEHSKGSINFLKKYFSRVALGFYLAESVLWAMGICSMFLDVSFAGFIQEMACLSTFILFKD